MHNRSIGGGGATDVTVFTRSAPRSGNQSSLDEVVRPQMSPDMYSRLMRGAVERALELKVEGHWEEFPDGRRRWVPNTDSI